MKFRQIRPIGFSLFHESRIYNSVLALSSILFQCAYATRTFSLHFLSTCLRVLDRFPADCILLGRVTFLYTLRKFRRKPDSVSNSGEILIYIYSVVREIRMCIFYCDIFQITTRRGKVLTIIKLKYKCSSLSIFSCSSTLRAFNIFMNFFIIFLYLRRKLNNITVFHFTYFTLFQMSDNFEFDSEWFALTLNYESDDDPTKLLCG